MHIRTGLVVSVLCAVVVHADEPQTNCQTAPLKLMRMYDHCQQVGCKGTDLLAFASVYGVTAMCAYAPRPDKTALSAISQLWNESVKAESVASCEQAMRETRQPTTMLALCHPEWQSGSH
jgi:hypothetical protein